VIWGKGGSVTHWVHWVRRLQAVDSALSAREQLQAVDGTVQGWHCARESSCIKQVLKPAHKCAFYRIHMGSSILCLSCRLWTVLGSRWVCKSSCIKQVPKPAHKCAFFRIHMGSSILCLSCRLWTVLGSHWVCKSSCIKQVPKPAHKRILFHILRLAKTMYTSMAVCLIKKSLQKITYTVQARNQCVSWKTHSIKPQCELCEGHTI